MMLLLMRRCARLLTLCLGVCCLPLHLLCFYCFSKPFFLREVQWENTK